MKLKDANPAPRIAGLEALPGKSNYFIGDDPQQWHMEVAHYARVQYQDVYPGINLIYYGNQRELEYDWVIAPGADSSQIKLAFEGVKQLRVDARGDLVLTTDSGEVRQHRPVIYQEVSGRRQEVAGHYTIRNQAVGFEIGAYEANWPLVIDPVLSYSSYLGGSGFEEGGAIAVDATGNIYVAGGTGSANFTTANALQPNYASGGGDCFIAKLNPSGTALIYSTYLGGSGGDTCSGLALDPAGNVYLSGLTFSPNFPTVGALQPNFGGGSIDVFVAKLNANGSALAYSTYLGGSGADVPIGMAVDQNGAVYLTGETASANFPTKNALQQMVGGGSDAFVTKVQSDGAALAYSTFLGGSAFDRGSGIALDNAGNAYISGQTLSTNFPLASALQPKPGGGGNQDAFVSKLNASGTALIYSTYLGGNGFDGQGFPGNTIAVDALGNAYLTGFTTSTNFPLANPLQANYGGAGDAFVTKLNASGSALVYSTYLGGNGPDNLTIVGNTTNIHGVIAVDAAGQAYVTGATASTNFPTAQAVQPSLGGDADAFVTKLSASGSALVYSTYLGGSNRDVGTSLVVDPLGSAYVTGFTLSPNLQTVNPLQAAYGGGSDDAFIVKLGADAVTVSAASFSLTAITSKAIVAAFGPNLATTTASASALPLPTTLAGTTVRIRDSAGTERAAPLFFVSANQINYQIPDGSATGPAAVTVTSGDGGISSAVLRIANAAPSIFTANSSGAGAAAALEAITFAGAPFNATQANGQPNIIAIFGTGLGADATDVAGDVSASVQVRIDGNPTPALYAGSVPGLAGLNQINVQLPAGINAGTHTLTISRNGATSNSVTIAIR